MQYAELIKQAAVLAGVDDSYGSSTDSTETDRYFSILKTSLLALNADDRLTFAVEDLIVNVNRPKLTLTPNAEYEPEQNEQVWHTDFPVEIAPAYVIAENTSRKMQMVQYETFLANRTTTHEYAIRIEYGKATIYLRYSGEIKIGLKKPLDMPVMITDEAKLIGTALNLVICKLAKDICTYKGVSVTPELVAKYSEAIDRHAKIKREILAPPILTVGYERRRF